MYSQTNDKSLSPSKAQTDREIKFIGMVNRDINPINNGVLLFSGNSKNAVVVKKIHSLGLTNWRITALINPRSLSWVKFISKPVPAMNNLYAR